MKAQNIFVGRDGGDAVVIVRAPYQYDREIRKSGPGGRTITTTLVDLVQVGRSEMTPTERYLNGNMFHALLPREVTLISDEQTFREIRAGMMAKSVDAAAELDAGRARLSDVLALFPGAVEKAGLGDQRDADGNLIEEPLRKGEDATLFGRDPMAPIRRAYGEYTKGKGWTDLKKAAAELDELSERLRRSRGEG